jgi:hypothetical protein
MKTQREALLRNLTAGDIFHAAGTHGESLLCLATNVGETVIDARTVTGQIHLQFNRQTGEGRSGDDRCDIDSVVPLPAEIHNVILGIDRKYRLETNDERLKLTDAEKKALLFVVTHYSSNKM